jgi:hypothetical protein
MDLACDILTTDSRKSTAVGALGKPALELTHRLKSNGRISRSDEDRFGRKLAWKRTMESMKWVEHDGRRLY